MLPSAPFEFAPDFRDIIPLTDDVLGDPDLYFFVIDSTEWYEDLNDNGRYDPRTDVLHDAAHEYGAYSYGPDGLYQPSYMYFGEPTLGGMLFFETGLQQHEEHNLLNWLVFGLAEVEL